MEVLQVIDEEKALKTEVTALMVKAEHISITTKEDYKNTAEFARMIKQKTALVKEYWKPLKENAHKTHQDICRKEKEMLKPLTSAERVIKNAMSDYLEREERERKRIEEEARRKANEAVERALNEAVKKAEDGDEDGAKEAFKTGEMLETFAGSISVTTDKAKADGVSTKKDWCITKIDADNVPCSVQGINIRPVDTSAVMKLIRLSKGQIVIPGITYEEKTVMIIKK